MIFGSIITFWEFYSALQSVSLPLDQLVNLPFLVLNTAGKGEKALKSVIMKTKILDNVYVVAHNFRYFGPMF